MSPALLTLAVAVCVVLAHRPVFHAGVFRHHLAKSLNHDPEDILIGEAELGVGDPDPVDLREVVGVIREVFLGRHQSIEGVDAGAPLEEAVHIAVIQFVPVCIRLFVCVIVVGRSESDHRDLRVIDPGQLNRILFRHDRHIGAVHPAAEVRFQQGVDAVKASLRRAAGDDEVFTRGDDSEAIFFK